MKESVEDRQIIRQREKDDKGEDLGKSYENLLFHMEKVKAVMESTGMGSIVKEAAKRRLKDLDELEPYAITEMNKIM